ncbi:hypothetical protein EDB19DRAFT_1827060 [Suillus lakei]|nr:hypothetical protein EDB19DRAFT_1827060 [Suillus lakei]
MTPLRLAGFTGNLSCSSVNIVPTSLIEFPAHWCERPETFAAIADGETDQARAVRLKGSTPPETNHWCLKEVYYILNLKKGVILTGQKTSSGTETSHIQSSIGWLSTVEYKGKVHFSAKSNADPTYSSRVLGDVAYNV